MCTLFYIYYIFHLPCFRLVKIFGKKRRQQDSIPIENLVVKIVINVRNTVLILNVKLKNSKTE